MSIIGSPEQMQPSPQLVAAFKENAALRARIAELEAEVETVKRKAVDPLLASLAVRDAWIEDLRAKLEAAAPSAAQAAGVESLIEAAEDMMKWCVSNVTMWNFSQYDQLHRAVQRVRAATPSEGVAAPVLEADLLALREDVAKLYQSAMAITSQAAQEFAQRVVEHVRRTHGVAPAQPSANQVASEAAVRDAALAECEAICNNVHDQYHAQRLIRELRSSGEKGADRG